MASSFTNPASKKAQMKRGLKTPARLGLVAARLFDGSGGERRSTRRSNASVSSHGSVTYDEMYLDQCHNWFTRETRAGKTPKPEPQSFRNVIEPDQKTLRKKSVTSKPRMKAKRLTKCLEVSSLTSATSSTTSSMERPNPVPGCAGCSADRNSEITSSNFFKLLSNNVLICSAHRFITHWMIDFWTAKQAGDLTEADFVAKWKPESAEVQADREIPFSVTEDRRLVAGVDRFGEDAWETILSEFYFVPSRTPEDLKQRWQEFKSLVGSDSMTD
jgi:hypothetical protein